MKPQVLAARHAQALLGAAGRLVRAPLGTAFTLLVLALALALPAELALLVDNVQRAAGGLERGLEMSVYLRQGTSLERANQLAAMVRTRAAVARVELVSAERGLEEFRRSSGLAAAIDALGENPLPHVLRVQPRSGLDPGELEGLRQGLAALAEADSVELDTAWVQRLAALLAVGQRLLLVLAALLGAGVVAVVGNTIRLEIDGRRAEIEVTKLVGGSNAFVRRPFLYTGALYGAAGGLLAFALLAGSVAALTGPVQRLVALYGGGIVLTGPDLRQLGTLVGGATLLGWIGAWVSCARHLRAIEPRA